MRIICKGLAPLGRGDHVGTIRTGCLKDRWVDVLPNKGKREGASPGERRQAAQYVLIELHR